MRGITMLTGMALMTGGMAHADIALTLPLGPDANVAVQDYSCDNGTTLSVQYINAGANQLAMIPLEGQDLLFVSAVSGSGARYVSGMWEWWSKGSDATLSRAGADPVQCQGVQADQ
ncbi:MliC family protein [Paracoccus sp. JM45]|uniref:MliC family protein n=1 Tax=Paracoccus sp. JM45 TaxID=2283626 RepID=UPI0015FEFF86|nr:MliC family protein [Paracoccus sp. JM45]